MEFVIEKEVENFGISEHNLNLKLPKKSTESIKSLGTFIISCKKLFKN